MAEGPGGFIEAILFLRKNTNDKYYGMTLQSEESEIPGWKKSTNFLKNNDNVYIENGIDNTGNLLSKENFIYCNNRYKNSMDLITGDGGFDFSADFTNQEGNSIKLIYSQVCFALSMQKIGGCFIIKMFDLFTQISIDILFLLSNYYKSVNIMKPNTSRYANSEKYIICKGFYRELSNNTIDKLIHSYDNINSETILKKIINIDIPYFFINKLEEINAIFGQQQIENIAHTISLIEKHSSYKIDNIKRDHFIKCINWCIKFNMPYNIQKPNNVFIYNKLFLK
jgi:cap1 methyltransferase